MKIYVKIGDINYGDIALRAMPYAVSASASMSVAVAKTLDAIRHLPREQFYSIFDAFPQETKNDIVVTVLEEHKPKLLTAANRLLTEKQTGLTLANYCVTQDLSLEIEVGRIDYRKLMGLLLPILREYLLSMTAQIALPLRMLMVPLKNANPDQWYDVMERVFGDRKDSILATALNQKSQELIAGIEKAAHNQGIRLKISALEVRN